jgi:hypothetical protein
MWRMMTNRLAAALGSIAFLLASGCVTPLHGPGGSTARISSLEGQAEIAHSGDPFEPASLWQKVSTGDRARTGANGKINFSLGRHGGVLTLMPDSLLEFERLGTTDQDSRIIAILNLREGRVIGDTLKLPEGKRVQVKTRGGVHEIP